jgi:hypothetical protein
MKETEATNDAAAQRLCESTPPELASCAQSSGCPMTRLLKGSTAVFALVVFLAINFYIATKNPEGANYKLDKSWVGWAVNDFVTSPNRPNVVFLGSSLMLVPLSGNDANYLNKKLDGSKHHHSQYFEDKLKQRTGYSASSYTFALPGEMPSDAYMVTNFLLKDDKRPDVIVYGVGPRDFMDNLLPSPSATDPFRVLSQLGPIDEHAPLFLPDWQARLDHELGKVFYFYKEREKITSQLAQLGTKGINDLLPAPKGAKAFSIFDRRQLLPAYRPAELEVGEAYFRPETAEDKKRGIFDNLSEYRKRYKTLKWDTFLTQMQFFASFLDTAKQRGIHVVVMAMPITDVNRSLLSDAAWGAYMNSVKVLAQAKGASYIDLHDCGAFLVTDFMDTVHLSPDGGRKMLDHLVETIRSDSTTLSYLNQNNAQIDTTSLAQRKGNSL